MQPLLWARDAFPSVLWACIQYAPQLLSQNAPMAFSFPDLEGTVSFSVESSYISNLSLPKLANVGDSMRVSCADHVSHACHTASPG